jgi:hypothetical protein
MPSTEDRFDILQAVSKKLHVDSNVFEGSGIARIKCLNVEARY